MVQLTSTFVVVAALAVVAPSFAAPTGADRDSYYSRSLYEDEVDEMTMREFEEIMSRAPQPWIGVAAKFAGKALNKLGTIGTYVQYFLPHSLIHLLTHFDSSSVASIGSAVGGMFKKKNNKRSLWDEEVEFEARAFEDEIDELDMRELVDILSRAPEPWLAAAGKVLNGLGTVGT
jgi:hypothetical protein